MCKRNSHTQHKIYVTWQYTYVYEVVVILLFQRKNIEATITIHQYSKSFNPKYIYIYI